MKPGIALLIFGFFVVSGCRSCRLAIGFICVLFVKVQKFPREAAVRRKLSISNFLEMKSVPIASVGFLISFTYASIITFIPVYANSLGLLQTASFFFVVYAVAMLLVRPFTGRIFDMKGPDYVIIPSLILFALGLVVLSYTESAWMLLLSGALIGLGYGTLLPSFQTLAIQSAEKHRSGYATGTFFAFYDSVIAVGAILLGVMAGFLGYSELYLFLAVFILLIGIYYKWISSRTGATTKF